ncbi:hypothetical protein [Aeromicrobium sp. UC242_57]|uniref:hypothetical protein n=1 Tax=Aeromicrobium sp. UC242_57 TaxID=3374624 RepID=UPI003792671F
MLLVLGATLLGARLAATHDDSVTYWSVRSSVAPGDQVQASDLEPARVMLSGSTGDTYVRTDEEFAEPLDDLVWAHAAVAGSLVAKDSLVRASDQKRGQLPLNVVQGSAPSDLARGDLVDVWVGPGPGDTADSQAIQVLESVRVLHSGGDGAAGGTALAQTVLVDVAESRLTDGVIATVASRHVTLVRVS